MCDDRTVDGSTFVRSIRSVAHGTETLRTVDGSDFVCRNVSGAKPPPPIVGLLGTLPTVTELTTSGTYTTPPGCFYIEVYVVGTGGTGGAGVGSTTSKSQGGGGGGGGVSVGYFLAGTYTVNTTTGTFHTMVSTAGGVGETITNTTTTYSGGIGGGATNSLYHIGIIPATPPGVVGGNGGGNFFSGINGVGTHSDNISQSGASGFIGAGGGGGSRSGTPGGVGGVCTVRIFEYY